MGAESAESLDELFKDRQFVGMVEWTLAEDSHPAGGRDSAGAPPSLGGREGDPGQWPEHNSAFLEMLPAEIFYG